MLCRVTTTLTLWVLSCFVILCITFQKSVACCKNPNAIKTRYFESFNWFSESSFHEKKGIGRTFANVIIRLKKY